jgi:hypothetical protein
MGENAPKIVIVVLVIVAVVFFIGIGVGANDQNKDPDGKPRGGFPGINLDDTIDSLGSTIGGLIPAPAVKTGEIHVNSFPPSCSLVNPTAAPAATPAPPFIQFGAAGCSITIDNSDDNVRAMHLQIIAGNSAHVNFVSNAATAQPMTSKADLTNSKPLVKLSVFKTGNVLTLSLCGSIPCQLRLAP